MKNLVLASLMAVLVSQAAGCIITSDDTEDYAIVGANWALKSNAGQTLTCPPGTTTAAVYAQAVDTNYRTVGQPFIDLYDCNAGVGNSDPLPPDVYQVWVELTSEGGGNVYATSTSKNENSATENYPDAYFLNVLDVDQTFKTTIYADAGYLQFDWDIRDAANSPVVCGGPIATVGALVTEVSNPSNSFDDLMHCNDLDYGLTGNFLQGNYTVSISARNAAKQALGPATNIPNVVVKDKNQVTDLGTVQVKLD